MPNHTSNKLTVTGAPEDIIAFIQKCNIEEQDLSFNAFYPMPHDHRPSTPRVGDQVGRLLCQRNPTTTVVHFKLSQPAALEEDTRTVSYFFDTAWCYPEPVIEAIFEQHPELTIEHCYIYEDGGGGGQRSGLRPTPFTTILRTAATWSSSCKATIPGQRAPIVASRLSRTRAQAISNASTVSNPRRSGLSIATESWSLMNLLDLLALMDVIILVLILVVCVIFLAYRLS